MLRSRTIFAWSVHALTAAGGAAGLLTLVALEARDFPLAVLLSMLALVIDAVDGTLARWADVKSEAPGLDGRRLDDIVDYLNYAAVPAFFMLASGRLDSVVWACLVMLSSAYGFVAATPRPRTTSSWASPPTGTSSPSTSGGTQYLPGSVPAAWCFSRRRSFPRCASSTPVA